jgi:hypothetical protein
VRVERDAPPDSEGAAPHVAEAAPERDDQPDAAGPPDAPAPSDLVLPTAPERSGASAVPIVEPASQVPTGGALPPFMSDAETLPPTERGNRALRSRAVRGAQHHNRGLPSGRHRGPS